MQQSDALDPTGERFIPELMGGGLIEAEHQARYRLALPYVRGKRVLDAGCGAGWGSRLIAQAGAKEVIGLDIAPDAVEHCRNTVPEAEFVVGDLQDLPFEDASFDVVVCFEALEHTKDTATSLDHLKRVLRPDGVLFVSSPNPEVYPAGNPFHFHEMPLEELQEAVSARFANVTMFRQHLQLAATLVENDWPFQSFQMPVFAVHPLEPGHDPYSVAIASDVELPEIEPCMAIAPSDQLSNLGTLSAVLQEERAAIAENNDRIVAERAELLEMFDDLNKRLVKAGEDLGGVIAERDSAIQQVHDALDRLTRTEAATAAERERLTQRIDEIAHERDQFALHLVRAEQELHANRTGESDDSTSETLRARLDRVSGRAEQLERDLLTLQNTVSWRVTRPLRGVRGWAARRKG